MRSSSSRGGSNITLTFNLDKNPDQAFQEVQQKLSTVVNRLPQDADPPVARKSDPDSSPVLMYSISAPRNVIELSDLVTTLIQDRIESADGVGEVIVFGGRQKQIKLYVDPDRLRAYNLSVSQVTNAVTAQNQELPGGTLQEGAKSVGLRTISKLTKGQVIAMDGKKLRRSHHLGCGKKALSMVSAWATANRLVLGQQKVDEKSNEVTAIPALLRLLELEGCIVTIDAMGCQQEIARTIVEQGAEGVSTTPEGLAKFIASESKKWREIIVKAGIPPIQ